MIERLPASRLRTSMRAKEEDEDLDDDVRCVRDVPVDVGPLEHEPDPPVR